VAERGGALRKAIRARPARRPGVGRLDPHAVGQQARGTCALDVRLDHGGINRTDTQAPGGDRERSVYLGVDLAGRQVQGNLDLDNVTDGARAACLVGCLAHRPLGAQRRIGVDCAQPRGKRCGHGRDPGTGLLVRQQPARGEGTSPECKSQDAHSSADRRASSLSRVRISWKWTISFFGPTTLSKRSSPSCGR
jgi:hypothetical protein